MENVEVCKRQGAFIRARAFIRSDTVIHQTKKVKTSLRKWHSLVELLLVSMTYCPLIHERHLIDKAIYSNWSA